MIGPQVSELLRSDLKAETVLPEHPGDILEGHSPASWSLSCTPDSGPEPPLLCPPHPSLFVPSFSPYTQTRASLDEHKLRSLLNSSLKLLKAEN